MRKNKKDSFNDMENRELKKILEPLAKKTYTAFDRLFFVLIIISGIIFALLQIIYILKK